MSETEEQTSSAGAARELDAPPERVWSFLTEAAALPGWLGEGAVPERLGEIFALRLAAGGSDVRGLVTAYDRPVVLEYAWTQGEGADRIDAIVRFELRPALRGTALAVTQRRVPPDRRGSLDAQWEARLRALAERLA